ncbi:hypothetical protein [Alkalihalobacillus deserti]|uniref:hypothetical protein n=1 Tax=Alkalihalobacillus deserti TaxID=2879466 RepID=UPI001D1472B5|nr:hypothetical protein [Alkalihalobacillus deserti]
MSTHAHIRFEYVKTGTFAVMVGFIIGSFVAIYLGITGDRFLFFISVLAFLAGGLCAYLLVTSN